MLVESQTWWKLPDDCIDHPEILTPERSERFQHIHLRTDAPVNQVLPLGSAIVPNVTTILHESFGYVQNQSVLNGLFKDKLIWPNPPANGENVIRRDLEYPQFVVPATGRNYQWAAPFKDTIDSDFSRFTRLNIGIGSTVNTSLSPKAQTWFSFDENGNRMGRAYLNTFIGHKSFQLIANGPINGVWDVIFAMTESSGGRLHTGGVFIDPDFHNEDPSKRLGTVIWQQINIDGRNKAVGVNTAELSNGVHKIAFIMDDEGYGLRGAAGCILVLWFEVKN